MEPESSVAVRTHRRSVSWGETLALGLTIGCGGGKRRPGDDDRFGSSARDQRIRADRSEKFQPWRNSREAIGFRTRLNLSHRTRAMRQCFRNTSEESRYSDISANKTLRVLERTISMESPSQRTHESLVSVGSGRRTLLAISSLLLTNGNEH